jgi:predicted permease
MSIHRDVDAELRFHFDARIEELVAQGLTADQARARAAAEFGDIEQTRDALRAIDQRTARRRRRVDLLEALWQDVRYVARSLRRSPAVSLTIILTLALGIGVNAAMFSLLDVIYLRPPAGVAHPEQLRRVWREVALARGREFYDGVDYRQYAAIRQAAGADAEVIYYAQPDRMRTARGEDAPTVGVVGAPWQYFRFVGLTPAIGRFYAADEDALAAAANVAVISYAYWQREYGGDARVLGRKVRLGIDDFTIIGVGPRGFRGLDLSAADVWVPVPTLLRHRRVTDGPWWRDPNVNGFSAVMRVRDGVNELGLTNRLTVALRAEDVGFYQDTLTVAQLGPISEARGAGKVPTTTVVATRIAAVAAIVLLIACANVVNLLLARAMSRRREIALRLALGVSRRRLVGLLMTEGVLLALVASAAAVVAAGWAATALRSLLMPGMEWAEPSLHWRVLVFALGVSLVVGIAAGLVPALQSLRADVNEALKSGRGAGRPRQRLRSALVVAQAALSVVLLVGAVLFVRSLRNVQAHDVGYSVDRLLFAGVRYEIPDSARDASLSARLRSLEARVAAVPGVERVAFAHIRPKYGFGITSIFPDADTVAHRKPDGLYTAVTPSYFAATGMQLLAGHTFAEGSAGPPAIIVNEAFANALWPGEPAIGHCVRLTAAGDCLPIIGVVRTAINISITEKPSPHLYLALDNPGRRALRTSSIIVRAAPGRLASVQQVLREIMRAEFPGAELQLTRMSDVMQPEYRPWRLGATLFTLLGVLALVVAGVGIYSTVSYGVSQRTHEFGVRLALGAARANVLRLVVGEGVRTVLFGILLGTILAIASGRFIAALLYGVAPTDPLAMLIVAAVLAAVAFVAAIVPARRAASADPVTALRAE